MRVLFNSPYVLNSFLPQALLDTLHNCLRACSMLVLSLPPLCWIVQTAGEAIASFQKELSCAACKLLEDLVVFDRREECSPLRSAIEMNAKLILTCCVCGGFLGLYGSLEC